jgi:hypothetical protein
MMRIENAALLCRNAYNCTESSMRGCMITYIILCCVNGNVQFIDLDVSWELNPSIPCIRYTSDINLLHREPTRRTIVMQTYKYWR